MNYLFSLFISSLIKRENMKSLFFFFVILLIITACKNSTEPLDDFVTDEYMSLNIGDIRQYFMPYFANPKIYTLWKITGKTFRSDGTEVFIGEWYTYNLDPRNKYVSYYFIRDGFYYFTELEKTSKYSGNPYFEQKLAKIKPNDGDTWLQTVGYFNPDSTQDYLTARHLDELDTPAGKFKDVYSLVSSRGSPSTEVSEIYYTKYFGHIGYSVIGDKGSMLLVNYMKVNGKETGKYVKMDSVVSNRNKLIYNKMDFIGNLGAKQK